MTAMRELMQQHVKMSQLEICQALAELNQAPALSHPWSSSNLEGGGVANIFSNTGRLLEKGGVNVSTVKGQVFPDMAKMLALPLRGPIEDYSYFATGISLVLHPHSPFVPTVHANYRYFEIENSAKEVVTWFFGGGSDLTPYYLFEEDAAHFHRELKSACDYTDKSLYAKLKKEADDYFYLPHRKEHRGIGGIFSLHMADRPAEEIYTWVQNCSKAFLKAYLPIVKRRQERAYTEKQKQWQLVRRGRYVEFNLLHDRGTHFGLKSGGHTENILMSLPPNVQWIYDHKVEADSAEAKLMDVIKTPKEWV